ncbi:SxtJ family membrane protein [Thiohalobacter sp.]|uniref:SxtJ family membrane protein n=1 Tax=Thiohalobacter sp. TaxID=2025948 RepID=UPI0026066A62|nr:SxtJ family membrane protein [Thiohalobacter sp.]
MRSTEPCPPSDRTLRGFGLLAGVLTGLVFGLALPLLLDRPISAWPWLLGGTLALAGLARPALLGPVYRAWMALGAALGWVNTRLLLGLVFYGLVLPIGVLLRLLGRDPLARGFSEKRTSYRVPSRKPDRRHFERPF